MVRIKTLQKEIGTETIDGQKYKKYEVKQVCCECGSDKLNFTCGSKVEDGELLITNKKWDCQECKTPTKEKKIRSSIPTEEGEKWLKENDPNYGQAGGNYLTSDRQKKIKNKEIPLSELSEGEVMQVSRYLETIEEEGWRVIG